MEGLERLRWWSRRQQEICAKKRTGIYRNQCPIDNQHEQALRMTTVHEIREQAKLFGLDKV